MKALTEYKHVCVEVVFVVNEQNVAGYITNGQIKGLNNLVNI